MANTEQTRPELVGLSADYFASNPDVDMLLVVVGTKVFYRPEREDLAAHEAAVAETSVMTIHRHEAEGTTPELVDVEGAEILPEFPAVVNTLELVFGSVKLEAETPRKLAEALYISGLQAGLTPAQATEQLEALTDYLMAGMAKSMSPAPVVAPELAAVLLSPLDELLVGALHIPGVLAAAPAAAATTEPEPAAPKAPKIEKPAAAPKAVKEKKATTPKAAK